MWAFGLLIGLLDQPSANDLLRERDVERVAPAGVGRPGEDLGVFERQRAILGGEQHAALADDDAVGAVAGRDHRSLRVRCQKRQCGQR